MKNIIKKCLVLFLSLWMCISFFSSKTIFAKDQLDAPEETLVENVEINDINDEKENDFGDSNNLDCDASYQDEMNILKGDINKINYLYIDVPILNA